MSGSRAYCVVAVILALVATRIYAGPKKGNVLQKASPAVPEYQEFYRTLANVTLDRYMDLISMPQVPSRYINNEEDNPNVSPYPFEVSIFKVTKNLGQHNVLLASY